MTNKRRKQQLPIKPKDYLGIPLMRRGNIYYTEMGVARYRARGKSAYKKSEHMEKKYARQLQNQLRKVQR